jgi:hypothetical protein
VSYHQDLSFWLQMADALKATRPSTPRKKSW